MPGHSTDHAGPEVLPFEECLRLLASVPVGRVRRNRAGADIREVIADLNPLLRGWGSYFRLPGRQALLVAGATRRRARRPRTV